MGTVDDDLLPPPPPKRNNTTDVDLPPPPAKKKSTYINRWKRYIAGIIQWLKQFPAFPPKYS